jgi:hypothetical protein
MRCSAPTPGVSTGEAATWLVGAPSTSSGGAQVSAASDGVEWELGMMVRTSSCGVCRHILQTWGIFWGLLTFHPQAQVKSYRKP